MVVYRPDRLAESILGLHESLTIPSLATLIGGIDSLESIPGLHKHLKIRAPYSYSVPSPHRLF
jgi:hypothetical protein